MRIEKFGAFILNATAEQPVVSFNVYNELLKSVSPHSAFSRLALKAIYANNDKAKTTLLTDLDDASSVNVSEPYHFWPSLTNHQWLKLEHALKELAYSCIALFS